MTVPVRLMLFLGVALPLVIAFLLDLALGDPAEGSRAERLYPPVLAGRLALAFDRRISRGHPSHESFLGTLTWVSVVGIFVAASFLFLWATGPYLMAAARTLLGGRWSFPALLLGLLSLGFLVFWTKSLFALRGLLRYCSAPLGLDLAAKRVATAKVVNRDTGALSDGQLNSALIESAAENTTDSMVAPLFAYGLFGLPGAVAYRAINTLDALLGHQDRHRLYTGRTAARMDHLVNVGPDLIAAVLLGGGARFQERKAGDRNPGVPRPPRSIVAMSGALRVRLEKPGVYTVGPGHPLPTETDVARALGRVRRASYLTLLFALALMGVLASVGWTYFISAP